MATLLTNPVSSGGMQLKRNANDATSAPFKKFKFFPDIDSDASLSGGAESIYSLQEHETATAYDTADTEEHEYEVQSSSEVTLSELSSEPENCVLIGNFNTIVSEFGSDISYVADLSDTFSSDSDELGNPSHKRCEKCNGDCEERFALCLKCFRRRKTFRPPRPKGRKRKNTRTLKRSISVLGSQGSQESFEESPAGSEERLECRDDNDASSSLKASQGSSQDQRNICKCCFDSPVDGVFIHKSTVHSLYCYKCSLKQWKLRGRCAFCNQKLCKVAKIFPVD